MQPSFRDIFRLGEWRVDPQRDEISKGAETIKLEPRTMRLLVYLAENAARVVGIQELLDRVWTNVVVTPQSVYNAIAQLRRVLGDSAETPTYISNVARKGYQLIAAAGPERAEQQAETPLPPTAATPVPANDRGRRSRVVAGLAVVVLSIVALGFVAFGYLRSQQ